MKRASIAALILGLGSSALHAQATADPPNAALPTVALPPVALPPALDRVLRDYERAWQSGNVPALVALFTDDGFVMQPDRPPARGHQAIGAVYQGQGGGPLRLRALAYAAADSVGFIIGAYRYGDSPIDQGKFTLTLRRVNGGPWRIASDMDNGSLPRKRPDGLLPR